MTFEPVETRTVGVLAQSPLRVALVQARTTPILALERAEAVERLLRIVGERWTLTDRQSNRALALQLGPGGMRHEAGNPETVWVLTSEDGSIQAALSSSSVAVESASYERWEVFRDALSDLLAAVGTAFSPSRSVRLGVRYVNEVDVSRAEGNPHQLAQQINSALLAPAISLDRSVLNSLAELRIAEEDDAVLALRHGLVDAGTYLLDLDAYRERTETFDAAAITQLAETFHQRIESIFAWALTEAYLDELRSGGGIA